MYKEFNDLLKYYISVYQVDKNLEIHFVKAYKELSLLPKKVGNNKNYSSKSVFEAKRVFKVLLDSTNLSYQTLIPFWESLVDLLNIEATNPKI